MKKSEYKTIKLGRGEIRRYQGEGINLMVYRTNDPLDDCCLVLEKGKRALVIEPPTFVANIAELEKYLRSLSLKVEGVLLAYHQAGASFFTGVKRYSTRNAVDYGTRGKGKLMVDKFAETFGSVFDPTFHEVAGFIDGDSVSIAGITVNIIPTTEAFDLEIPEIRARYVHLLGHDVHSLIDSAFSLEKELAKLEDCLGKGYDLVLSSHYLAEDLDDVRAKVEYLKRLRDIAAGTKSPEEFKLMMQKEFPEYHGEHFLNMSAQALFR